MADSAIFFEFTGASNGATPDEVCRHRKAVLGTQELVKPVICASNLSV
jgi:hypothetical protein